MSADSSRAAGRWIALGAVLAGLAVGCGAFAAHFLDAHFAAMYQGETRIVAGQEISRAVKHLADFRTGAEYQMFHALGMILVGVVMQQAGHGRGRALTFAAWSFLAGIVLFSGSLYALTLTGQTWLGAVTPFGGVSFLAGWGALAVGTGWRR